MEGDQNNNATFNVDLVLCIDGTMSIYRWMDRIKDFAISFYAMMIQDFTDKTGRAVDPGEFRVRCIVFRDYKDDGEAAMEESRFFNVAEDSEVTAFEEFVRGITATDGGDAPQNALEAIFTAMKSDWNPSGGRFRRQIIMLFTDAPFLPLQDPDRTTAPNYPLDVPATLEDLQDLYERGGQMISYVPKLGRLIIFAPYEDTEWARFRTWERTWIIPCGRNDWIAVDLIDTLRDISMLRY